MLTLILVVIKRHLEVVLNVTEAIVALGDVILKQCNFSQCCHIILTHSTIFTLNLTDVFLCLTLTL